MTLPTKKYNYSLCIRQHPIQGRTSNQRDGRSIEPPAVLELIITDSAGKRITDYSNIEYHKFVANVLLVIPNKMVTALSLLDLLDGSKTVECRKLFDPEKNVESLFFVFSDLFCRGKGDYILKISLFDLIGSMTSGGKSGNICTVETNVFTIYSPKEYPGRLPISNLSLSFLNQGLNIQSTKIKRNYFRKEPEHLPNASPHIDHDNAVDSTEIGNTEKDYPIVSEKDGASEVKDPDTQVTQYDKNSISNIIN